jgi:hypothetical protein
VSNIGDVLFRHGFGHLAVELATLGWGQEKSKPGQKYDVKRCLPKVVSHVPHSEREPITVRKGDESTHFSAVVAFQILESGP